MAPIIVSARVKDDVSNLSAVSASFFRVDDQLLFGLQFAIFTNCLDDQKNNGP